MTPRGNKTDLDQEELRTIKNSFKRLENELKGINTSLLDSIDTKLLDDIQIDLDDIGDI